MLLVFFVAGRQALLQHFADSVLVPHYRKVAAYITSLPGVRSLTPEDQHNLLKCKYIFTTRQQSCGKVMFSVVYIGHSFCQGGGLHVTTTCDALGQSQLTWDPPCPTPTNMGTLPQTCSNLVTLGQPPSRLVQTCSLCRQYISRQVGNMHLTEIPFL